MLDLRYRTSTEMFWSDEIIVKYRPGPRVLVEFEVQAAFLR